MVIETAYQRRSGWYRGQDYIRTGKAPERPLQSDGEFPWIAGLIGVELIILPRLQLIGWKESLGRNPLLM